MNKIIFLDIDGVLNSQNTFRDNHEYSKFFVKYMGDNPEEYANTLFSNLRDFDEENVDVIFAEDIDDKGINLAVSNRLYKAAGYKFIEV